MDKKFSITPKYDILLRGSLEMPIGLFHLHLATAEQICPLYYKMGCLKAVKARLKDLVDAGYIQMDSYPVKHVKAGRVYFSSKYYYTLTAKGIRYLASLGMDTNKSFRSSKEINKHSLFIEHALELNDVIISAALVKRLNTGFYLHDFVHERTLRKRPYTATWIAQGREESHRLIPDALLDFRYVGEEKQLRIPVLIEHDRGTEAQKQFRRRISAYIAMLKAEAQVKMFGSKAVTIAFTTFAGESRLAQMRQWARQELSTCDSTIRNAFRFANLNRPLDPYTVWFSPYWQTAIAGDKPPSSILPWKGEAYEQH